MKRDIDKQLNKIEKKEKKILEKKKIKIYEDKISPVMERVEGYVPERVKITLDDAFYKGFNLVLSKGVKYVEKLYDKDKLQLEHDVKNYAVEKKRNKKSIKELDKLSRKSNIINTTISTIEGSGLGLLGIGIPDIPIFITMILKTIYEISLSYGFDYEKEYEQIYFLNLICGALTSGEEKEKYNVKLEQLGKEILSKGFGPYSMDEEIKNTSKILSEAMITSKFVQGLPIVGVIGGIANFKVINKIAQYSKLKYKKRYLIKVNR